ncbi:F-box protein SKIP24 isoform X1 [Iris pallida]|uniref:F-box protein SKIP24 isoform X1 n=1 Tax=Iris pallida TaxID=29817 RepID=A0AAX6ERF0_IRIPA|nr:F-box protein SKIP24 isoform X1 [Iris pallida]
MTDPMSALPDELWHRILNQGVRSSVLTHRDLCSVSIAGRRLRRLSGDPSLWSSLLSRDFPSPSPPSSDLPSKSLYKTRFKRDRARREVERRLAVLRAESDVAERARRLKELEGLIMNEREKLKAAAAEVSNLENVRRSSVALNVWQPEVVRGRQKQIVEQCTVPIDSRLSALSMEVRVCKQQIAIYSKAYNDQKQKLKKGKKVLKSVTYHPVESYQSDVSANDRKMKQKKMKKTGGFQRNEGSEKIEEGNHMLSP